MTLNRDQMASHTSHAPFDHFRGGRRNLICRDSQRIKRLFELIMNFIDLSFQNYFFSVSWMERAQVPSIHTWIVTANDPHELSSLRRKCVKTADVAEASPSIAKIRIQKRTRTEYAVFLRTTHPSNLFLPNVGVDVAETTHIFLVYPFQWNNTERVSACIFKHRDAYMRREEEKKEKKYWEYKHIRVTAYCLRSQWKNKQQMKLWRRKKLHQIIKRKPENAYK